MNTVLRLLVMALVSPLSAAQTPGVPMHGEAIEIFHCVSGPSITIGAGDERALLDDDEREALLAEMVARYPMLERDGFAPPVILMWHKAPETWLYVSLRPNTFANAPVCFTASFVAKMFRITPRLMDKYFL